MADGTDPVTQERFGVSMDLTVMSHRTGKRALHVLIEQDDMSFQGTAEAEIEAFAMLEKQVAKTKARLEAMNG